MRLDPSLTLLSSFFLSSSVFAAAINHPTPPGDHLAARTALPKMNIVHPAQYADHSTHADIGATSSSVPTTLPGEQKEGSGDHEERAWSPTPWWDWWKPKPTTSTSAPAPDSTDDCDDDGDDGAFDWVWLNERGEEVSALFDTELEARRYNDQLERPSLLNANVDVGLEGSLHVRSERDNLEDRWISPDTTFFIHGHARRANESSITPSTHASSHSSSLSTQSSHTSAQTRSITASASSAHPPTSSSSVGVTEYTHGSAPIQTGLPNAGNNKSSNTVNTAVLIASILLIVIGVGLIACILYALYKVHKRKRPFGAAAASARHISSRVGGGDEERVYQSGTPVKPRGDYEKTKLGGGNVDYSYSYSHDNLSYGREYADGGVDSPTPVTAGGGKKKGYDIQAAFERKRRSDELRVSQHAF